MVLSSRMLVRAFTIASAVLATSCSYERINIPYDQIAPPDVRVVDDVPKEAKHLGTVKADEKGALFDACDMMLERSLLTLVDGARGLGGNTITNVRWIPNDGNGGSVKSRCKKRWGFALFYPLLFTDFLCPQRRLRTSIRLTINR